MIDPLSIIVGSAVVGGLTTLIGHRRASEQRRAQVALQRDFVRERMRIAHEVDTARRSMSAVERRTLEDLAQLSQRHRRG